MASQSDAWIVGDVAGHTDRSTAEGKDRVHLALQTSNLCERLLAYNACERYDTCGRAHMTYQLNLRRKFITTLRAQKALLAGMRATMLYHPDRMPCYVIALLTFPHTIPHRRLHLRFVPANNAPRLTCTKSQLSQLECS